MNTADLKQCLAQGENATTEFKESFNQETIETTAAFANASDGTILIGISDSGKIREITIGRETLRNWSNRISQAAEPRVVLEIGAVDVEGKSVLWIRVEACRIKPVSVKGICYKRVGKHNVILHKNLPNAPRVRRQNLGSLLDTAGIDDMDKEKS